MNKTNDPHKSIDYIKCKFYKYGFISSPKVLNKHVTLPTSCTIYFEDPKMTTELCGNEIFLFGKRYINSNIRSLLSDYIIDKVIVKGTIIYSREKYYKRFKEKLKRLIERSKLYAEICGRPERLKRLGYFDCS